MSAEQRLVSVRVALASSAIIGAVLMGLAVASIAAGVAPGSNPAVITLGALTTMGLLWWWRGVFSRRHVVLWLEDRVPTLRYALAALVDAPGTPFRPALESRIGEARFGNAIGVAAIRLVAIPVALLLASQFVVVPFMSRIAGGTSMARSGTGDDRTRDAAATLRYTARVTPPRYSGQPARQLDNPLAIAALVGTDIRFDGAFTARTTMPASPTALRLEENGANRVIALEPRLDSAPRVVLELPARDTVLAAGPGAMRLAAVARDDIGITSAWFELIVSSGTGESFTFRSAVLGRANGGNERDMRLAVVLPLDSLDLKPGDVVHLRAVARDANPAPGAEPGSSETRTLRIPRAGENDSLSVEAAPPPEVGKSELSQRMLIILTERLVARIRSIDRPKLATESNSIAREQARLRKRVGEIIFTRLTGEDHVDEDATTAMDDTLSPGEALLRAASEATNLAEDHAHEEGEGGPVIGVNRNLLEAFNAMWEAERRLGVAEPRQALPHMQAALDAIQRARAAERLYLRGRPPKVVLDVARIRLSGKREGIDPSNRSPRASDITALLSRRARFAAALDLLATDRPDATAAAVDTLMLARIDAITTQPALASALGDAIERLRSGQDATESLVAVHRALSGTPKTARQSRWSGGW
ncbi:MAG TPA: hypothetical protein VEB19_17435 [Gemmatimonadaceae bacterium]|nr:hypothetical protein [Gemmatimonadaceae bacterium]